MINPDKLFSREALDKMRSPEKLDTLLQVTTPVGWIGPTEHSQDCEP